MGTGGAERQVPRPETKGKEGYGDRQRISDNQGNKASQKAVTTLLV